MTMLEYWVGSLQDLFPGNCAGFVKERNQQTPGGAAGDWTPGTSDCEAEGLASQYDATPWAGMAAQE